MSFGDVRCKCGEVGQPRLPCTATNEAQPVMIAKNATSNFLNYDVIIIFKIKQATSISICCAV